MTVAMSFALSFLMTLAAAGVQAQERMRVTDIRPLMIAAIDATDGRAHGVLVGDMADLITRRFNSSGPIWIDVTTQRRLAQSGCSRLQLAIWQDDVQLPGAAAPRRQTMEVGINYCRDGSPPRSSR